MSKMQDSDDEFENLEQSVAFLKHKVPPKATNNPEKKLFTPAPVSIDLGAEDDDEENDPAFQAMLEAMRNQPTEQIVQSAQRIIPHPSSSAVSTQPMVVTRNTPVSMMQSSVPMEVTRKPPASGPPGSSSSSSARKNIIPKKGGGSQTMQAMPKTESKSKAQAPVPATMQNRSSNVQKSSSSSSNKQPVEATQAAAPKSSSSGSNKRPVEATRPVFVSIDETEAEQPKQKKQRTGDLEDPAGDFGIRLQAVMYRASELDSKRLLGPYIIRWLFFVAMEMLPADNGQHWMDFVYGCILSFLAPKVVDVKKKWIAKSFHGDELASFMTTFANTIVKIANDTISQNPSSKMMKKTEVELSPEYINSSVESRKLAVFVVQFLQRHVKFAVNAKTRKIENMIRTKGDVELFEKLRREIRLHLYRHTRDAVNRFGQPPNHAWFIWDFLEECTDEQVPPSRTEGVELGREERAKAIHDGSMINNLLHACFEISGLSKQCGMLRSLYVVEQQLHLVSTTDKGTSRLLAEEKAPVSALKGLTALAVLLSIANAQTMLPSQQSPLPEAKLYKSKLDEKGVFEELFKLVPSLPTDVIQYISICRAQLKQRYKSDTPPSIAPPAERKTKFSDWAFVKLSSSSSAQGQGADKLIGAAKQFLLEDLTVGLLTSLGRSTRNVTLSRAVLLLDEFLAKRIGVGVVRPLVIADAVSATKEQKRELARSAFARAFEDGVVPNDAIAKDTGDFRLWADLAFFRVTDTSIHLDYAGFVWSLASRGDAPFDVADKFIRDDNAEFPLIDKPRANAAEQQSNLSKEHVLDTGLRGGSGRFLTWWLLGQKRICTFGVLKTHADRKNPKEYPLTMLVLKDMELLLKLHVTDVLDRPLAKNQIERGFPLTSDQMDKLQYMYNHAKGGFEDDKSDDKYCVDFRVLETLKCSIDTTLHMHKSKATLSIFSGLPSLAFLQGGVAPVEAWRSAYLSNDVVESKKLSLTGDEKRDELMRTTNDNLLDELMRVNARIQKVGKTNQLDMSDDPDDLSVIPADLKPAYAGLFDLLAACRVRGYMADAEVRYHATAGRNVARNAGKRELLKLHWDKPDTKALHASEQIRLIRDARAAQMAFLQEIQADAKTTSGHPSMTTRLSREIETVQQHIQLLEARLEEVITEEEKAKDEEEKGDDFEATEAVQDAEMHMNAFLQIQSDLVPIIRKLDGMMENPNMEKLQKLHTRVTEVTSAVYEVLLTLDKDQFAQNFNLYEQRKICELLLQNEAAVKENPMLQYWISTAKGLRINDRPFMEIAAELFLINRFRTYLIAIGNDLINQAEDKLGKSEYILDGGVETEGSRRAAADDDEEDDEDEDDEDRQFEEDKALRTEADRINALSDSTLISVCVETLRSCGLQLEDLAPNLQEDTRDLLIEEEKLSTVASSSVDLGADMIAKPAPLTDRDTEQKMVLTEDGKERLKQTKYRNVKAIKLVQKLIAASEKKEKEKSSTADDTTAMMSDDDDDDDSKKPGKKKKGKQDEVLIKNDADRTTLQDRVTRLRIVLYILEIADPDTKLGIDPSILEPFIGDIRVHQDLDQILYLLNEDSSKFNKRANKMLEIEFAARKAIKEIDGKRSLEFIVGAEEALQTIRNVITKRFTKRNVNEARKQLQLLSQSGRDRLISVYLRGGKPHPRLPLYPLMEEICGIVHHTRRPKLWTMLQTAADLLQHTPAHLLDRWMNTTWNKKMVSGFASGSEKYMVVNKLVLSKCLPYRILRAQLLFGLVPSITDTEYSSHEEEKEEEEEEESSRGILETVFGGSAESYHLHLFDLETRIVTAKVITNPNNYKNGTMGIDAAIRMFMSKNSDTVEEEEEPMDETKDEKKEKKEKKTKKTAKRSRSVRDPSSLTDFPNHEETERFLAGLCSELYDKALGAEAEPSSSSSSSVATAPMNTTEEEEDKNESLSTMEKGYPFRRRNFMVQKVLDTFASEFRHSAKQQLLDEKTIKLEVSKYAMEDAKGNKSLTVDRKLIVDRLKRDQIMNALFNKAFEWRLPDAVPPSVAAVADAPPPPPPSENDMLTELAKEQLDYMYNNIRTHLLLPMFSDIEDSPLSKECGVLPEVEQLLRTALKEASKPETLLTPIKLAIEAANARMDIHLSRLWQETRKASAEGKLPPKTDEKLFGMDSNPQAVLDAFQKDGFNMEHLLALLEHRQAFYQIVYTGIKYMQLLPLLIRVIRQTLASNKHTFEWTRPPANLGLLPPLKLRAEDKDEAERLRERIYVKFQELSEILVNHSVYLPAHLDLQAVLEAYWGLDTLDEQKYRKVGIEETKADHLMLFHVLYPASGVDREHLQTVRRMLGWQNPRDALEFYVYKRQIPAGQNFDASKYRDPIAPVHWEEGTIRLEELKVSIVSSSSSSADTKESKEEKKRAATYAYWNPEAVALRYTAKLARLHFGLAVDAPGIIEAMQAANGVFRTLAVALQMLQDEKTPTQHILTKLAIPKMIESQFADDIKQANNSARMQHLYRGVFSFVTGGKDEIITAGGTGRFANRAGKVKAGKKAEAYLVDTDSIKLGLRAEKDVYYDDVIVVVAANENEMRDDGDEEEEESDKRAARELIGSLTYTEAAVAIYFKETDTTEIAQLGNFAHWVTVGAWQNEDKTLRDRVIKALGGNPRTRAPRKKANPKNKKAKTKKTAKDQEPLALPLPGEGKETKAEEQQPVVVTASVLPRSSVGEGKETKAEQKRLRKLVSLSAAGSSSSSNSMDTSSDKKKSGNSMDTSGRLDDNRQTHTPSPRQQSSSSRRRRRLFYADSNPVVVTTSELTTHPASLVPTTMVSRSTRRKLLFASPGTELQRVPVSVS